MSRNQIHIPSTRRDFIKTSGSGIGLIAFSSVAPSFLTQSIYAKAAEPEKDNSILVLIQLAGGNDGLNTVIPYQDDSYYKLRPKLGIHKKDTLPIDDMLGLHSSCEELSELYKEGTLSIIQNVGYPNPNRSHFRSTEIWETASNSKDYLSSGWIGRYFDNCCSGSPNEEPLAMNIGNEMPDTFLAEGDHNIFSFKSARKKKRIGGNELLNALKSTESHADDNASYLRHTFMNTLITEERVLNRISKYKPFVKYPQHNLGKSLQQVAALISSGQPTRVYYVTLGGFDTHANQAQRHSQLLRQLSTGMAAFQKDLAAHKLDDQVMTMTFSEFGRRPNENNSGGTDHGTAAPLFVMGSKTKGGLFGTAPNLELEKNMDLDFSTDFRSVYSTVLDRWLRGESKQVIGGKFNHLPFV